MKRLSKWVFFLLLMATLPSCSKDSNPTAPTAPIETKESNPTAPIETVVVQGITFVSIPGGTFLMGSNWETDPNNPERNKGWYTDEQPVHQVTLSAFQMSATEITNTQYAAYLNTALADGEITVTTGRLIGFDGTILATGYSVSGAKGDYRGQPYIDLTSISYNDTSFSVETGKENWPVEYVYWYGSKAFALKYGFDLPREAEWEYAARGGKQYEYGTDDGTVSSDNIGSLKDVGSYPPNPFGLYDLAGSVLEWCNDWYTISYSSPSHIVAKVVRGWVSCDPYAKGARSAARARGEPNFCGKGWGFRVVRR